MLNDVKLGRDKNGTAGWFYVDLIRCRSVMSQSPANLILLTEGNPKQIDRVVLCRSFELAQSHSLKYMAKRKKVLYFL